MKTNVITSYGEVQGFQENGLNKWLGIPFAKPPIGELRFRRAVECEKWNTIKKCTKFKNKPIQFMIFDTMGGIEVAQSEKNEESEDCLYLNISRTDDNKKKLPVFVWIYGGGFSFGEASEPSYDGSAFAQKDIVHVSISYRVGPLGFYDFSTLNKEQFDSNCGLSDMIMALKWIKENIELFGGDPNNITIAGESAGGASVCALLASPKAKGLFNKAISMSGLPDALHSKETHKVFIDIFLEQMKLNPEEVLNLRSIDPSLMKAVAQSVHKLSNELYPGIKLPAFVLDDLLPESPGAAAEKGCNKDVKLIIGTTHHEGNLFMSQKMIPYTWEMAEKMCSINHQEDKLPALKGLYENEGQINDQLSTLGTDLMFLRGSIKVADGQSKYNDVWMYRFDYEPEFMKHIGWNAVHGSDIVIALGTANTECKAAQLIWKMTPEEIRTKLMGIMHEAWVNFAKSGNPNSNLGNLGFVWEKYDAAERKTLSIDEECRTLINPAKVNYEVWKDIKLYP